MSPRFLLHPPLPLFILLPSSPSFSAAPRPSLSTPSPSSLALFLPSSLPHFIPAPSLSFIFTAWLPRFHSLLSAPHGFFVLLQVVPRPCSFHSSLILPLILSLIFPSCCLPYLSLPRSYLCSLITSSPPLPPLLPFIPLTACLRPFLEVLIKGLLTP